MSKTEEETAKNQRLRTMQTSSPASILCAPAVVACDLIVGLYYRCRHCILRQYEIRRLSHVKPHWTKTIKGRPDQTKPEQAKLSQTKPNRAKPSQAEPSQIRPDPTRSSQAMSNQSELNHVNVFKSRRSPQLNINISPKIFEQNMAFLPKLIFPSKVSSLNLFFFQICLQRNFKIYTILAKG